jgi:hypothetical protein
MKVKSGKFLVFGAVLAVSVSLAGIARADSVSGSVWENSTSYPNNLSTTLPAVPVSATFTLSSPTGVFNLNSNGSTDYTLYSFLHSGNDAVAISYMNGAGAGDSINDDTFQFTGTTYLVSGTTYTLTKDDAAFLSLNGGPNVLGASSLIDTAASDVTFSVGTTGYYSFDLLYQEVNGPPAVLSGNIGTTTVTPEPGSIFLLGSGLLALAGLVRRTITA